MKQLARKIAGLASAFTVAVLVFALAANTAAAARLRPYVEIVGPVVHLADLFSGLDQGQDVQLGAAPAPGSQLVIRSAQLSAIADQFGVSWDGPRDGVSTTLLRKGHPIDIATAMGEAARGARGGRDRCQEHRRVRSFREPDGG